MRKAFLTVLAGLVAQVAVAESVIQFDVEFDTQMEASGAFIPVLFTASPGEFNNFQPLPPSTLVGTVTLTVDTVTGQLSNANGAINQIVLNGTFSTESGNSPASGWSVHSFSDAVFDLYKPDSYLAIDWTSDPDRWPAFTATNVAGKLADHGPASLYGGNCPFAGGCRSAASAGTPNGNAPFLLFEEFTPVFNSITGSPIYPPAWRDSGTHPRIAGEATQTFPAAGLGYNNGMDGFVFQGVLDATNALGNGAFQPYPDGVQGQPGKVRIIQFSSTGATAYAWVGNIVPTVPAPLPAGGWMVLAMAGFLAPRVARRR